MSSRFELFPYCSQFVFQGLFLELIEIEHKVGLALFLPLPVLFSCVVHNCIRVFLQVEPIALIVLPHMIGLAEPLFSLSGVQIHQGIIGLSLASAVLITSYLVITVLQVSLDHIH